MKIGLKLIGLATILIASSAGCMQKDPLENYKKLNELVKANSGDATISEQDRIAIIEAYKKSIIEVKTEIEKLEREEQNLLCEENEEDCSDDDSLPATKSLYKSYLRKLLPNGKYGEFIIENIKQGEVIVEKALKPE